MSSREKVERKLAAIMFTDIAGYTALSGTDETKALALLDIQKQTLTPIIEAFNGTLHKEIGDGLLFTFLAVTDAVKCAIEIQHKTKSIENLSLRIGIHEGEITLKDGDVLGDDVNVASRIEPFAAIGGIAISGKVQMNLSSLPEFEIAFIGKPKLKGVSQEVKVYCITSHGLPKTDVSKVSAKLESENKFNWNFYSLTGLVLTIVGVIFYISISFLSLGIASENEVPAIAILPFENKGDPQDEFYAYGISSDLIADVTSAGLIRVAGLKDIEKLEFADMSYDDLSDKLFVRYVAQGTLWKMDSVFQLSMEIYDTQQSKIIYTKRWQTNWNKLTSIKDDLSDNILNTLKVEVNQKQNQYIASIDPKAYEYYLKARHKYAKRENTEDVEIVRGLLKKAFELDDNLILAKLWLGSTYIDIGDYDKAMQYYTPALKQAELIGDKPSIALSLNNIGRIYMYKGNYEKALDYYSRSLEIREELDDKSGISISLNNIGAIYFHKGDDDKSLDYFSRCLEISEEIGDKSNMGHYLNNIGVIYGNKGDYDKMLYSYKLSLEIHEELGDKSGIATSLNNTGWVYLDKGDYEKALEDFIRCLEIREGLGDKTGIAISLHSVGFIYLKIGDYDKALDYLNRSLGISEQLNISEGLREREGIRENLYSIGIVYYEKGDYNKVVETLEGYDMRDVSLINLSFISYLYLSYKKLGKDYDEVEVRSLLNESKDKELNPYLNYALYELLEDRLFLEKAYNQFMEKTGWMDEELKNQFFNYSFPKKVISEYNRVNS